MISSSSLANDTSNSKRCRETDIRLCPPMSCDSSKSSTKRRQVEHQGCQDVDYKIKSSSPILMSSVCCNTMDVVSNKVTFDLTNYNNTYPYFKYVDHSRDMDPDPSTPLTAPGKVPNFPAKMHAILSQKDLHDIVSWMPHGRSWKVHKPREFELLVIPLYFEHVKYSSFVRQANGWGFHRITVDKRDRNSYYHPLFLRGLPHLCKNMKRPGVSKKTSLVAQEEPDFYEISKHYPIPEYVAEEKVVLPHSLRPAAKNQVPLLSLPSSWREKASIFSESREGNVTEPSSSPKGQEHRHDGEKKITSVIQSTHTGLVNTMSNRKTIANGPYQPSHIEMKPNNSFGMKSKNFYNLNPVQTSFHHQRKVTQETFCNTVDFDPIPLSSDNLSPISSFDVPPFSVSNYHHPLSNNNSNRTHTSGASHYRFSIPITNENHNHPSQDRNTLYIDRCNRSDLFGLHF